MTVGCKMGFEGLGRDFLDEAHGGCFMRVRRPLAA